MMTTFLTIYFGMSILSACVTTAVSILSFRKKNKAGFRLGMTCIMGTLVNVFYIGSILPQNYRLMSMFSSFYFISFDWILISLLGFVYIFIRREPTTLESKAYRYAKGFAVLETLLFIINIFHEIEVTYDYHAFVIAGYEYRALPGFIIHLIFTYAMVMIVVCVLIYKLTQTPRQYRPQYYFLVVGIIIIVAANAVFLFQPEKTLISYLDYSIIGYAVALVLAYWGCFKYARHNMLQTLSMLIFDEIDQGLVLFDYEGYLTMCNARGAQLLDASLEESGITPEEFRDRYNINIPNLLEDYSIQCYPSEKGLKKMLRCDYKCMKDEKGRPIAYLYTFMDVEIVTDLLTGFYGWDFFKHMVDVEGSRLDGDNAVIVMDINNLTVYNSLHGRDEGDKKIRELAQLMREHLPIGTNFVRGHEAELIAVCFQTNEQELKASAGKIIADFDGHVQYGLSETASKGLSIEEALDDAVKSLNQKKLMNQNSGHSQVLNSLVRAVHESDPDTEAHERRTMKMGAMLGERIGLSDRQQSQLSLLCLLHDIGKIGIPLEILNKPGRLSTEEWEVLKTHVRKGYDIAMSTSELSDIAEMILHHHERWDGKGYPDGLSRETIPLLSRMISIVDAFDAMVHNRPYKKAMSVEQAVTELRNCAGTQFDPHITAEFIRMVHHEKIDEMDDPADYSNQMRVSVNKSEPFTREVDNAFSVAHSRYILDEEDYILEVDDMFEYVTGYSAQDVTDRKMRQRDLIPEEDRPGYEMMCAEQLSRSNMAYIEHRIQKKDGSDIYVFCFGKRYYDSAVRKQRSEIIIFDSTDSHTVRMITKQEGEKSQLRLKQWENIYRRDALTGLLNHIAFENDVEQMILSGYGHVMMLMLDVDRFKNYNDTYGHQAGDELLILFARTLESMLRKGDLACRMGGDEFAAVLGFDAESDAEEMKVFARNVFEKINMELRKLNLGCSLSMGVSIEPGEKASFNELYHLSDNALYQSKKNGRALITFFDEH